MPSDPTPLIGKTYYGSLWHLLEPTYNFGGMRWATCGCELKPRTVKFLDHPFGEGEGECRHCLARLKRLEKRNDE